MSEDTFTGPGPEATFWARLREGRLVIQRCMACGGAIFYPRVICPVCGAVDLKWVEPSGQGVVYSTVTVRQRPEVGGPYNIALIELDEGPRLMSRVERIALDEVQIGLRVQAEVTQGSEGPLLVFRPVLGAHPS